MQNLKTKEIKLVFQKENQRAFHFENNKNNNSDIQKGIKQLTTLKASNKRTAKFIPPN